MSIHNLHPLCAVHKYMDDTTLTTQVQKGSVSHIQTLMDQTVSWSTVNEIKESKYYSISVDSTPDVCHTDQITFTVMYLKENVPTERFLEFIPIYGHGSEYLANTVLTYLAEKNIPMLIVVDSLMITQVIWLGITLVYKQE